MRGKSTPLPFATDRIDQLPAKDRVDASFKAKDQNSLDLRVRKDKNFVDLRTTRLTSRSELRPQLVSKEEYAPGPGNVHVHEHARAARWRCPGV